MGLSTKHVSGDHQGFDFPAGSKTTPQTGAPELPKPPSMKRQHPSEPLKCPRCDSTNTKFCYYNNYNKSQPRHFCKSCKRHWTKGGTLRNVPIGGVRKNKRPKIRNASVTASTTTAAVGLSAPPTARQDPNTEFRFSSFVSTFDMNNPTPNPISYHESLNAFDDQYTGILDSVEESTITNVNNIPSSSNVPWPGPEVGISLELPNYWNWNEIDVLTSSDHLNISWADDDDDGGGGGMEIKPQS
ncbi:hypothetical protein OROGR_001095 [Orobanche gracilis]